jgi:CheY-like chemotaxis protein
LRALARSYRVIEARMAARGVEAVRNHRPAVVVTDILMLHKEGIETIREIQELPPATKIIAISGGAGSHNLMVLDIARAFGVDALLAKPFPLAALMDAVDRLVGATWH